MFLGLVAQPLPMPRLSAGFCLTDKAAIVTGGGYSAIDMETVKAWRRASARLLRRHAKMETMANSPEDGDDVLQRSAQIQSLIASSL